MSPGYLGPKDVESIEQKSLNRRSVLSNINLSELMGTSQEDHHLKDLVLGMLHNQNEVNSSKIRVAAKSGIVFITGTVSSEQNRATVIALVEGLEKVDEVVSYLEIDDSSLVARSLSGEKDFTISIPQ